MKIIYPNGLLYEFLKRAQNQSNSIAYVVGYRKNNLLVANEIVFPDELCPNPKVSSLDKKDFGKLEKLRYNYVTHIYYIVLSIFILQALNIKILLNGFFNIHKQPKNIQISTFYAVSMAQHCQARIYITNIYLNKVSLMCRLW